MRGVRRRGREGKSPSIPTEVGDLLPELVLPRDRPDVRTEGILLSTFFAKGVAKRETTSFDGKGWKPRGSEYIIKITSLIMEAQL